MELIEWSNRLKTLKNKTSAANREDGSAHKQEKSAAADASVQHRSDLTPLYVR
jgi:hypothetical protein